MKRYSIIYADPPWQHHNTVTGGSMSSGAGTNYYTMSTKDICELNVNKIAEDNAWLFMWWVASMPQDALRVVTAWGFKLKTMTVFSWIKKTANGKDHFGMGFHTRQQQEQVIGAVRGECDLGYNDEQEHCLVAKLGKAKIESHSVRQNVRATVREHSEKPEEVRENIVKLCGDLPRIELFARTKFEGWDAWGKEVQSDIDLDKIDVSSFSLKGLKR